MKLDIAALQFTLAQIFLIYTQSMQHELNGAKCNLNTINLEINFHGKRQKKKSLRNSMKWTNVITEYTSQ